MSYGKYMADVERFLQSIQDEWGTDTKITDGWVRLKIAQYIEQKIKKGERLFNE